jgi:hypothetical protein
MYRKFPVFTAFLAIVVLLGGRASFAEETPFRDKAAEITYKFKKGLKKKLIDAINENGFGGAVEICSKSAQEMPKLIEDKHPDVRIRRVSLKNRNPKNAPDEFERKMLNLMESEKAAGELKLFYEREVTVDGKPAYRYMEPLLVGALCLNCHGKKGELNRDAVEKIRELYPNDKAVGYGLGDIRGAVTLIIFK